jgi:hypothetical protein
MERGWLNFCHLGVIKFQYWIFLFFHASLHRAYPTVLLLQAIMLA